MRSTSGIDCTEVRVFRCKSGWNTHELTRRRRSGNLDLGEQVLIDPDS
jgi:hypothetical protein